MIVFRVLFILLFASLAHAADYEYYFSNSGSGSVCSEAAPCATLAVASTKVDDLAQTDSVTLYFKRGDTWTWNSAAVSTTTSIFDINLTDPIVHIDAYGTGDKPIFDGLVTDFSTAPDHSLTTGPLKWNRFFQIARSDCSISNVEIKNVYGHAIYLKASVAGGADGFTLSYSDINNFGSSAVSFATAAGLYGIKDSEIAHNTIHTGQQLNMFGRIEEGDWSAALALMTYSLGDDGLCQDNTVKYNTIYDIHGEGIINPNSIIEYNIIGDTASFAIGSDPRDWDNLDAVVRYNLVMFSDYSTSEYTSVGSGSISGAPVGIRWYDEISGGDNSAGNVQIYGNIIINRTVGIWFFSPEDPNNPLDTISIHDNIVIDSTENNYRMYDSQEANTGTFTNNSSILYNRTTSTHIVDDGSYPDADWTITANHYWTTGGSPTVDSTWDDGADLTDPSTLGGSSFDWTTNSGSSYWLAIDPETDINPPVTSPIYDLNAIIDVGVSTLGAAILYGAPASDSTPETPMVSSGGALLL